MGYVWAVSKPVGKSLEGLLQVHVRTLSWQSYMFMYIWSKTTLSSSTESGFRNCSCDKGRGEIMYELDWVRCDRFQDQTCLILWFSLWIKKPCRVVKKKHDEVVMNGHDHAHALGPSTKKQSEMTFDQCFKSDLWLERCQKKHANIGYKVVPPQL